MNNRSTPLKEKTSRNHAYETAPEAIETVLKLSPASPTPVRWTCRHHAEGSDITGFVLASGGLETIARTRQADGIDARANAELIVRAVNNHDRYLPVINDLVAALELCLKCEGMTWAAEQEADLALRRVKGMIAT